MFEIESKNQDEIILTTKKTTVKFNIKNETIDANLAVGKIKGPGEFEIGDATIRGILTTSNKTIYDVEVGGIHIGILGDIEENLDDIAKEIIKSQGDELGTLKNLIKKQQNIIKKYKEIENVIRNTNLISKSDVYLAKDYSQVSSSKALAIYISDMHIGCFRLIS